MSIALALGAMALAAVALLAWPLVRKGGSAAARTEFDRAVFRDQLRELERDVARGVIAEDEATAARLEIERRILATASEDDTAATPGAPGRGIRGAVIVLIVLLPAAGGALYLMLGSPHLPGQPFAERPRAVAAPTGPTDEQIGRMVAMLEARLAEKPDELQGWTILTTAYLRLARPDDAHAAYRKSMALAKGDAAKAVSIAVNYGEALTAMNGGQVVPRAKAAFNEARKLAPKNPAAAYYLGLARIQAGDRAGGLAAWRRLVTEAPPDAPWLPGLKQRIESFTKQGADTPAPQPDR